MPKKPFSLRSVPGTHILISNMQKNEKKTKVKAKTEIKMQHRSIATGID